jgi:hypothetical protein
MSGYNGGKALGKRYTMFANGFLKRFISLYKKQWRTPYALFGLLTLLLATLLTIIYYLNYPYVEINADTPTYLGAVQQLQTTGNPVNTVRLPAYPLLIVIVYALAGQGNNMALSIVQGVLFVFSAVEFYLLAALLFRRSWLAFLLSLLVSTNIILLSYSKPIMSEGLALWLLTTLVLLTILFLRTRQSRLFWAILVFQVLLCFTRPEWTFLPLLLYGYLFFVATRRIARRHLLARVLVSAGLVYLLLGSYVAVNAFAHGLVGLTYIENMNMLGKVLQYRMQMEAPPEYREIGQRLDLYVHKGQLSPYVIMGSEPELARDNAKLAGQYARSIVMSHPFEFLSKSVPYFFFSLTTYHTTDHASIPPGPLDAPLSWLFTVHRVLYACNAIFPYCALLWFALLIWKRTRDSLLVRGMALVAALAFCATVLTTLGGYFDHDYMRVHIVFDPLILLTAWGVLGMGMVVVWRKLSLIWTNKNGRYSGKASENGEMA